MAAEVLLSNKESPDDLERLTFVSSPVEVISKYTFVVKALDTELGSQAFWIFFRTKIMYGFKEESN